MGEIKKIREELNNIIDWNITYSVIISKIYSILEHIDPDMQTVAEQQIWALIRGTNKDGE